MNYPSVYLFDTEKWFTHIRFFNPFLIKMCYNITVYTERGGRVPPDFIYPASSPLTQTVIPSMKYIRKMMFLVSLGLLLAGNALALNETDIIDTAVLALRTGRPDSAAVLLYDIVEVVSDSHEQARAMFYLAQTLGALGRTDEQIQYLVRAAEIDSVGPYADDVRFAYAEALLAAGNINGCLSVAQELIRAYPDSPLAPDTLFLTGKAYMANGEWLNAFNAFSETVKTYPGALISRQATIMEGVCLYRLQLFFGAIDRLEKPLIESFRGPGKDDALYYLGLSYEETGQPERAASAFRTLIFEHPSYPGVMNAYFFLGKNLFAAGDYDEAENAFRNFIENAPGRQDFYDEALLFLERIAFRKGRYSSETDIAENFVAKYPASRLAPKLLLDLARYYRLSESPENALEKYQAVLTMHPNSAFADSALNYQADTYVAMNRPDRAISFLSETARRKRNLSRSQASYLKLGMLGEDMQLHDKAIAWYDSAVGIGVSPDLSVQALLGVARCFQDVNRWLDASKTYERILRSYPKTPHRADVHYSLAGVYYLMGRVHDAVQTARDGLRFARDKRRMDLLVFLADVYEYIDQNQAIRYYMEIWSDIGGGAETRAEALLRIGDIFEREGDRKSAAEAYSKIIEDRANSFYVEKATKKLNEIGENGTASETITPR